MRAGDKTPLKERFEAAAKEFATTFSRKARMARAGLRPYPSREVRDDLCAAASSHGLFAAALWAYFWALRASLRGENDPLRPRGSEAGGVGAIRKKRVLLWGVVASFLLAAVVAVESYALLPSKYEAEAKVLVGLKEEQDDCYHGVCLIPNAPVKGIRTHTLTVARAIPTTPVAQAVVRRLNLPRGSADKVLDNTSVESDPGTMFVDITYRDSDPKRAQQIANAIGQVASQKISEVNLASPESRVTVALWQPAMLPETPVSPNPLRNGFLALVASLTLTSGWAVLSRPALTAAVKSIDPNETVDRVKRRLFYSIADTACRFNGYDERCRTHRSL